MGLGDRFKNIFKSKKGESDDKNSVNDNFNRSSQRTVNFDETNFKYLDELIHSGINEIILSSDVVLSGIEESKYKFGIQIDVDDLVIDGAGHTIDACGKAMIFFCTGKNIVIKNVILKNGLCIDDSRGVSPDGRIFSGGAICNMDGDLTVKRVEFIENNSQNYAGALYNTDGKLSVFKSSFKKNYSKTSGGAITNMRGEVTIEDSIFDANTSMDSGAIFNGDKMSVSKCKFKNNESLAIYTSGGTISSGGEMTISNSEFSHNTSKGATLYNRGILTIMKSIFKDNTTSQDNGIIYNHEGNIKIFESKISDNESNYIVLNNDAMNIQDVQFKSNRSKHVISNRGSLANVGIFGGEFGENASEESVIHNNGKFSSIERSVFAKNDGLDIINCTDMVLINPKLIDGGRRVCNNGFIDIKNSPQELKEIIFCDGEVVDGEADQFIPPVQIDFSHLDQLIHEAKTKEIILDDDICLQNYEIDFYEGGIVLDIDGLTIDGAGKTIDGAGKTRIFVITGKNITLKNINFVNGCAHRNYDVPFNSHGGILKVNGNCNLKIKDCIFSNSSSEENGGAIYNRGKLEMYGSKLIKDKAKYDGGAIYNTGELAMFECETNDNSADNHGGAISNEYILKVFESSIAGNASQSAGGIYNSSSKSHLEISKSQFINNSACLGGVGSGGAIYVNGGKLEIEESEFHRNISEDYGGAIINYGDVEISHCILMGNDGCYGGGAIDNRGKMLIIKSQLNDNIASKQQVGGAIWNHKCELAISECELDGNRAEDNGGAIYNYGRLEIADSWIANNISGDDSAAIENTDNKLFTSTNCSFENNVPRDIKK